MSHHPTCKLRAICRQTMTCRYVSWIKSVLARSLTLGCQSCCRVENNHSHREDEQGQLPQCQEEEGVEGACLQEGVGEEGVCCHRHPCPPLLQHFKSTTCHTLHATKRILPFLAGCQTDLTQRQACFRNTTTCNFKNKSYVQMSRQQTEQAVHDLTHTDEQNTSGRDSRYDASPL